MHPTRSKRRTARALLVGLAVAAGGTIFAVTALSSGHSTAATTAPAAPQAAPATPAVATSAVTINNFAFTPPVITVKAGTSVSWTNNDEEAHTVFSGAAGMKSPVLDPGGTQYSFSFATPGTYNYNCTIHPFMHGTVVVTA